MYMRREKAAEFCDVSLSKFDRWAKLPNFPEPKMPDGTTKLWTAEQLTAFIEKNNAERPKVGRKRMAL
jgi:hypothetical protein